MLFSELYKIIVNKVTFVSFRWGAIAPRVPAPDLLEFILILVQMRRMPYFLCCFASDL